MQFPVPNRIFKRFKIIRAVFLKFKVLKAANFLAQVLKSACFSKLSVGCFQCTACFFFNSHGKYDVFTDLNETALFDSYRVAQTR
jgi:hypothetical protein